MADDTLRKSSVPPPAVNAVDLDRLRALNRTKAIATGALVASTATFLTARAFQPQWPWLGYVAATAEAATIGGLADWYAVVALFKRPLGLPIPHTAIIPENQGRIAANLGRFIEQNFLDEDTVRTKLAEVDFATQVADWLVDPNRADGLARFVVRLTPQALQAIDHSGVREFVAQRIVSELEKVQVAPLAAGVLNAFVEDGRHQRLFDELTRIVGRFLEDEAALGAMRERIRAELPSLFNLFKADAFLLNKIIGAASALLEEARNQPDHPIRLEFDAAVRGFIRRLKSSKLYARRAEEMKHDLLSRPEVRQMAGEMWDSVRNLLETDARSDQSVIQRHLASLFVEVGRHLAADPVVRADMNQGFVTALSAFIESQKPGVSSFITEQVNRWDLRQLVQVIELNVGRDLQFIRFNGMIIGGLAGLAIYTFQALVFRY
jgi:uncharacterized membrane-anchored protein YjiN (DUF445 family)